MRKTLVSHYDYAWLVSPSVVDELINSDDEELRERLSGADLTTEQAIALSKDKSPKVREALARNLGQLKITQLSSTMSVDDIERIADQMYLDNKDNKNIVKALVIALPETRQLALAKEDMHYLSEGVRYLTSVDVINYLLTNQDIPAVWDALAHNKKLPLEYKKKLWQRTLQLMLSKRQNDQEDAYDIQLELIDTGTVDEELFNNAIDLLPDLPAEYRYRMRNQLFDKNDLPAEIITRLDTQYRFNSDWALSVIDMTYSTRRQSENGLRRWNDDESAILAELDKLADKPDDEWWVALLHSSHDPLRQSALVNAHTPASALAALSALPDRAQTIDNPQLPANVKAAWLKEEPSLLLYVDHADPQQLRQLAKTGISRQIRSEARDKLRD